MARLRTGLRLRIAATIAGIVTVAVAALALGLHLLLVRDAVDAHRDAADERMQAALAIYGQTGVLSFDARLDAAAAPARLRDAVRRDGSRATLVSGGHTRVVWAAGRSGAHVLTTRATFPEVDEQLRRVDRAMAIAGGVTVVLASLVGLLLADRLARRLRIAAHTARGVTGGEDPHSLRAAVGTRRDEIGDLADAVDAMAERLNQRLLGEQRFTADVAHDLRTPVTGLVTAAALLDDSRPAELVRDRAAALTVLVEDLLEVSRLDRGVERARIEPVDLGEMITRLVDRGVATGEYAADDVVVRLDPARTVLSTDPRRLERVVDNLVRNGLRHGAAPVEVEQDHRRITVRDHGPGFDAALLAEGPQRFRTTARGVDGNGLGLVIAAGQAAVLGVRMELRNDPGAGAVVVLDLPTAPPSRPGHSHVSGP